MRSVNFRDSVLWAIAEKDGLDPTVDLLNDLAREYVSSINAWLRRLYDVADWPEWAELQPFIPNPSTHIISWDASPFGSFDTSDSLKIGKVFKVYLCDPRITPGNAMETPFRLTSAGIHVGFDHGATVWLKFIPRTPVFTSEVWNSARTYQKDEITYSTTLGECCKSKVNNNKGHDPAGETTEQSLPTEITVDRVPDDPGLSLVPKIMDVDFSALTPDPAGTINYFSIYSDAPPTPGGAVANVVYNGIAGATATQIRDGVLAALIAEPLLASYTFTAQASPERIRVQKAQNFSVFQPPYSLSTGTGIQTFLKVTQVQAYIPATPSVNNGSRQFTTVSISQVKSGAIYALLFTDDIGDEHAVSYTALVTDKEQQIIAGLINAILAAKADDAFFNDVFASLDITNLQLVVSIGQSASLDATMTPPNSAYWSLVPFPFALADQVVRGVYADSLKTGGQSDKGNAEEQAVPTETQLRMNAALASGVDALTDQQTSRGRYAR